MPRPTAFALILLGSLISVFLTNAGLADEPVSRADAEFFESKVRPLLIARCDECHGAANPKAGLRLNSRDAILAGGESGPAAVPGKPMESLLVDVIGYRNTIQMPPKAKLPETDIATLTEWVRRGLPWPDSKPAATTPPVPHGPVEFTDEQKSFWAFQPVKRQSPPAVRAAAWLRSPVDQFILAGLESHELQPARETDRRHLLRRVFIDLVGLPPTPDEVAEFLDDSSPDAFERVIDRLLASPRYGERWARHWLDIARYADSNGLDENLAYANAFRYRDYVIRAFQQDKPYDRFLIEQIAGDLLESKVGTDDESLDALTATGFLCLGAKMLAEDDPVKMNMDIIDEQVDTIARAVMGLTMGCARCHDHKFDPLTMDDYYGMAGVFKSTQTMDTFSVVARWHERPLASPAAIQQRDAAQALVTTQNQAVEKLKADASNRILTAARGRSGSYLLAATGEYLLAERVRNAKPRGNDPEVKATEGTILVEAEDYARGNVTKDRETYGKDIGVLVNRGETPNFTEYDITPAKAGLYQLELRYAAAGSRPVKISVNGKLVKPDAAAKVTGSWMPDTQTWFVEGFVRLGEGRNVIRLEQPQFFPHIDKLLLTPVEVLPGLTPEDDLMATPEVVGSIVQKWAKLLEKSKADAGSILSAWHQYVTNRRLSPDPSQTANGIERLLGESQPSSLQELAARYDKLFTDANEAWAKATEADKSAKGLSDPVLEAARSLLMDPKGPYEADAELEKSFPTETIAELKSAREQLERLKAAVPKFPEAMAVADLAPENLKIHLRGSHLTLGREVPRQVPSILAASKSRQLTQGSGRLQLAQWLARPEHPLTSRVMVNRVWQWHFGQGIVRSPDNFGRLGERPTHPELLDWLASEFGGSIDNPRSWSLKSLHRRLLETATYRQSTEYNPAAALADPENKLYWRSNRQRMDVEVMRDSLLAVSGQLDEAFGGSMLPTANRNYVTSTANVNPAIYQSNRRAVYLPVVRSALYEVFTAFDFADPSTLAGQRDQTTIATQALFMMNSAFVFDQSRSLATKLLNQTRDSSSRLHQLYLAAYSRAPSAAEVDRAINYLNRLTTSLAESGAPDIDRELRAWTSLCRAILASNEFLYVD